MVAGNKKISQPYWLEYPLVGGTFEVSDQTQIGKAENDPSFETTFIINIASEDFTIKRPVQYRVIDPVKGDVYEPIPVIPRVLINVKEDNLVFTKKNETKELNVSLKSFRDSSVAEISILQPWWLKQQPRSKNFFLNKGEEVSFKLFYQENYSPPPTFIKINHHGDSISKLIIGATNEEFKITYPYSLKTIKYDHIPPINYFLRNDVKTIRIDLKIVGKKIGYIVGAGDKVPLALEAMGYSVETLSEADLTDSKLKLFDAIITGIRAYNIHEYLSNKNDVLMRYVENGGNLIVQYLKSNQVGAKRVKVGPYPFIIDGGSRVTEEDAKVNFLLPNHSVLNYPNKITEKDFEGWVQERSTYQALQLDQHYETPLGMNDKDEKQTNGSLVIAKYGKGNFVYASLVFFRQLPAGVPGAYRLIANLIALGKGGL